VKSLLVAAGVALLVSCSSGSDASNAPANVPGPTQPPPTADRCVVMLHGKGGGGGPSTTDEAGVVRIFPNGNQPDGGGRKWIYFPDDEYAVATKIVGDAIAASSCKQVILSGFSNGAAFAAKLYCRGEGFGDTVVGVVIDDPVPDAGTASCAPDPATSVSLVWTGGLAGTATPGWNCSDGGWICDGGETVGIDAYAAALGTTVTPSPFSDHQFWSDNPALSAWP
jgi:hypothetical protein